jgi:hypothetical protein
MATMDVFKADAFTMMELSSTVDNMDYNPGLLGSLNLFSPSPVRQKRIFVDQRDDTLSLIPFSERGSAGTQNERYTRKAINFEIPRIAIQDTVWAHEISGLREFGTETELMTVQREVAGRLAKMRQKVEYTEEYLRLAAIQGRVLDPADGSTFYNYYTEFNISEAAAVSFELDVTTTDVLGICNDISRAIQRSAKGAWVTGRSQVHALAGDDFYDALINHPNVNKYYLNWMAAQALRETEAFGMFRFGPITFHNYRGSDDNTEIAVATNEAKFFVVGGDGIFVKAMAPADEFSPFVNTPGQAVYAVQELDAAFPATPRFNKFHVHAYPLYMCQKPNTLRRGTLT